MRGSAALHSAAGGLCPRLQGRSSACPLPQGELQTYTLLQVVENVSIRFPTPTQRSDRKPTCERGKETKQHGSRLVAQVAEGKPVTTGNSATAVPAATVATAATDELITAATGHNGNPAEVPGFVAGPTVTAGAAGLAGDLGMQWLGP